MKDYRNYTDGAVIRDLCDRYTESIESRITEAFNEGKRRGFANGERCQSQFPRGEGG